MKIAIVGLLAMIACSLLYLCMDASSSHRYRLIYTADGNDYVQDHNLTWDDCSRYISALHTCEQQ